MLETYEEKLYDQDLLVRLLSSSIRWWCDWLTITAVIKQTGSSVPCSAQKRDITPLQEAESNLEVCSMI